MKNVNDFVKKDVSWIETLSDLMSVYKNVCKWIDFYLSRLDKQKEQTRENQFDSDDDFSLKEQLALDGALKDLIAHIAHTTGNYSFMGVDLISLRIKLRKHFKELGEHVENGHAYASLLEDKRKLLCENITFDHFFENFYHYRCVNKHFFVRLDEELICMNCGATTKDYPLTNEELDFLTLCADSQNMLLKDIKKCDLPLLQVLMEKNEFYRSLRKPINTLEMNDADILLASEYHLYDENELAILNRKIKDAHLQDSETFSSNNCHAICPKYLSDEKTRELLLEVERQLEKAKTINSRFKALIIEECITAKYEILILSGAHIPSLLAQAQTEDEKIALTKAYYNISNCEFRVNSEYFDSSEVSAYKYDRLTASPEINNRILQMKVRR